jgi:phosphoribosylglycinamide formyltransferase 1
MRFVVFISGQGTNLQAIIDAVKAKTITAELAMVISSNAKALGLKRAEQAGIKTLVFDPKSYTNTQSVDRDMAILLKQEKIDLIVLAGYMRILTPFFVKTFHHKILNIHPSLLPSFKGTLGIKDAITYGVKISGVTVHYIDDMLDHGPIILQESVKLQPYETVDSLAEKIHKIEHRIYPKAIQLYVEGRLKIKGRKVMILEKPGGQTEAKEETAEEQGEESLGN